MWRCASFQRTTPRANPHPTRLPRPPSPRARRTRPALPRRRLFQLRPGDKQI
uniref:Uncharacterized protein n=1 Tax=Arundo donax TaxID=35708 RepID=A0A0A9CDW6_ARUDO